LLEHLELNHAEIASTIKSTGKLDTDTEAKLKAAVEAFKAGFRPEHAAAAAVNDSTATGDVDKEQETISKRAPKPKQH
jgi:hypothetical protein